MLSISHISKNFGSFKALDDVSFTLKHGMVVALLGLNGAGKSTLMRIMTGFLPADFGFVELDGIKLQEKPEVVKAQIGYLPEHAPVYSEMRSREFLEFIGEARGVPHNELKGRVDQVMEQCHLTEMANRQAGKLSKGYRHRLGIAQAIINNPGLLILDEPTDGLDPMQKVEAREMLAELGQGRIVIVSTHILEDVSTMCNHVVALNHGKVCYDGPVVEDLRSILNFSM